MVKRREVRGLSGMKLGTKWQLNGRTLDGCWPSWKTLKTCTYSTLWASTSCQETQTLYLSRHFRQTASYFKSILAKNFWRLTANNLFRLRNILSVTGDRIYEGKKWHGCVTFVLMRREWDLSRKNQGAKEIHFWVKVPCRSGPPSASISNCHQS